MTDTSDDVKRCCNLAVLCLDPYVSSCPRWCATSVVSGAAQNDKARLFSRFALRRLPSTLALSGWDHWPRYRIAIRHDLALYPLVGHSETIRQRLGRLPAELLFY